MENQQEKIEQLVQNFLRFGHFIKSQNRTNELKQGEIGIIRCLFCHTDEETPELKPSQISAFMGLQQPTITPLLRSLEENGYVIRRSGTRDRREVFFSLSEKGADFLRRRRTRTWEMFQGLTDYLGDEKTEQLMELMEQVSEYMMARRQEEADSCHAVKKE